MKNIQWMQVQPKRIYETKCRVTCSSNQNHDEIYLETQTPQSCNESCLIHDKQHKNNNVSMDNDVNNEISTRRKALFDKNHPNVFNLKLCERQNEQE